MLLANLFGCLLTCHPVRAHPKISYRTPGCTRTCFETEAKGKLGNHLLYEDHSVKHSGMYLCRTQAILHKINPSTFYARDAKLYNNVQNSSLPLHILEFFSHLTPLWKCFIGTEFRAPCVAPCRSRFLISKRLDSRCTARLTPLSSLLLYFLVFSFFDRLSAQFRAFLLEFLRFRSWVFWAAGRLWRSQLWKGITL